MKFFCIIFCIIFLLPWGAIAAENPKDTVLIDEMILQMPSGKGIETVKMLNDAAVKLRQSDSKKSLFYAQKAVELAEKVEDYRGMAKGYVNVGVVKRNFGRSADALVFFEKAQKIASQNKFPKIKADAIHKIGVTYLLLKDYENALQFANRELKIWQSIQDMGGISSALNFKGYVLLKQYEFAQAEPLLDSALKLGEALNDTPLVYKPLVNLADLYLQNNRVKKALEFIEHGLEISKASRNSYGVVISYYRKGEALKKMKNYTESIVFFNKSLSEAKKLGFLSLERNCYNQLSEVYAQMKNFEEALRYKEDFIATEDTILRAALRKQAEEMQLNFDLEKGAQDLKLVEHRTRFNNFFLLGGFFLLLLVVLVIWLFSHKHKTKKIVSSQETTLSQQASDFEQQKHELEKRTAELVQKKQKIDDSLNYAKQVQESMLPPDISFFNIFKQNFVINYPKNIISGDFYWYTYQDDSINLVIADCSGHGVSGAFNTVIINSIIAQIVHETSYRTPADLLEELHKRIVKLIPRNQDMDFNIGIKIGILRINVNSLKMVYAGAKIPLYYITDDELKTIKADKIFVGGSSYTEKYSFRFKNKMISLKKNDKLLLFTDGYQDQFGEDDKGKFMVRNLRTLLQETAAMGLMEQRRVLLDTHKKWRGEEPQTDDILAFGIQI